MPITSASGSAPSKRSRPASRSCGAVATRCWHASCLILPPSRPAATVLGYAYAAPFRTRSAYRYSIEDSIYVAPTAGGGGIGGALLAALIEQCAALGYRQMMAVIGDSGNLASIGLHEGLGFRRVGLLPAVGFKLGRWVDIVLMQRALGGGASDPR